MSGDATGGAQGQHADEDDLCRVWAARRFPADRLITASGERFTVVYPGRRSGGAGPDFQGAMLADSAGRLHTGDVELHLRAGDWIAHGHRADPAYNRVVLHVVLEDDGSPCLRADGRPVPVVALAPLLQQGLEASASAAVAAPLCQVAPHLDATGLHAIVRSAARSRLDEKAQAIEAQIAVLGAAQTLFTGLLDAAGYSRNRVACALLADRLPIERLEAILAVVTPEDAPAVAEAVLLGLAGLLRATGEERLRGLWGTYADRWPLPPLHPEQWVRAGVRPANRPELRLRGLAALLARHHAVGIVAALLRPLRAADAAALVAALEVAAPPTSRTPPIGGGRAVEMAINVVVPFALAVARADGDARLEQGAWATAAALPGGEDSDPVRQMATILAAGGHTMRGWGALERQGLLHLYRSYCALRAGWECPLHAAPSGE